MARKAGVDYKDVHETVPYTINWAPWLNGSTLSTVAWDTDGLTSVSTSNTTSESSIRVSGGTPGKTHILGCTATLASGAIYQTYIEVPVDNGPS